VPPSAVVAAATTPIAENGTTTLTVNFTDPGTLDTHVVTVNWGDPLSPNNTQTFALAAGVTALPPTTHQYLDDNPSGTSSDTYTVTVTVVDDDQGTAPAATGTAPVQVDNVPPVLTLLNPVAAINENGTATLSVATHGRGRPNDNAAINENGTATLSGTFADPGTLDVHTLTVDWQDGSPPEVFVLSPVGTRSFSVTHQYLDDGPYGAIPGNGTPSDNYNIAVSLVDDDQGTAAAATGTAALTVNNVAPSGLTVTPAPATINENGLTTISGSFADPGTKDWHSVVVDWNDGSTSTLSLAPGVLTFNVGHQYLDDGFSPGNDTASDVYAIAVTVLDDDDLAAPTTAGASVTVNNVPPSNLAFDPVAAIDENGFATLTGNFVDPGTLDLHPVTIDWGDPLSPGNIETFTLGADVLTFTRTHQYRDDNPTATPSDSYTIGVTVDDDDLGSVSGTAQVTVNNVAPSNLVLAATSPINENDATTLSLSFVDPGTLDVHRVDVVWGDNSADTFFLPLGARSFTATHTYLDDGPSPGNGTPSDVYSIQVTVTDDDTGAVSGSTPVTVNNVAPSNVLITPLGTTVSENGAASFLGSFTDPGTLDVHTVTVDWGDGSASTQTVALGQRVFLATHQYMDDDPTGTAADVYPVTFTVTDDDTGVGTASATVTVNNVAPSNLTLDPVAAINENDVASLHGNFLDPGIQDTFTVTVAWGDGAVTTLPLQMARSFTMTHQYVDDGPSPGNNTPSDSFPITVTVADDDTGSVTGATTAQVNNVAPVVGSLQGPASFVPFQPMTFSATFTDVGPADLHTATIDWGDGTVEPGVVVEANGAGTVTGTHAYVLGGAYTVQITVGDDDTGVDTVQSNVNLAMAMLQPDPERPGETALFVAGTVGNDHIHILQQRNGWVVVEMLSPRYKAKFSPTSNGQIYVFGDQGNDRIEVAGGVTRDTVIDAGPGNDIVSGGKRVDRITGGDGDDRLFGNAGNDALQGGGGNDMLNGGSGDDTLAGGAGDDILFGGTGTDLLQGNEGNDALAGGNGNDALDGGVGRDLLIGDRGSMLQGGAGEDILISGLCSYSSNERALLAIMAEWGSAGTFDTRVDHLIRGGGLNGRYRLRMGSTVKSDRAVNTVFGNEDADWFLLFRRDDQPLADREASDRYS
jgi:hypothetical protein